LNEAVERVFAKKNDDGTLRLGRTPLRPRCKDRGKEQEIPGAPVPPTAPGDFNVRLGDVLLANVLRGLENEFASFGGTIEAISGFLSAVHCRSKCRGCLVG